MVEFFNLCFRWMTIPGTSLSYRFRVRLLALAAGTHTRLEAPSGLWLLPHHPGWRLSFDFRDFLIRPQAGCEPATWQRILGE